MKFLYISTILSLAGSVNGGRIVSGSNSRLPQSLSSVINDLEAEGADKITTFAFLTSRGVTKASKTKLLQSLFGIPKDTSDDHEEAVNEETTAFGKKMGYDHDTDDEENGPVSFGIAIANPLPGASVTEVAATVQACGGNIVFVASLEDLNRGEGFFEKLAPAIERILNHDDNNDDADNNNKDKKTLVVVVEGATTAQDLLDAKQVLESAATTILSSIVQPDPNRPAATLQQVFDSVEFVPSSGPVDQLLEDIGASCDPSTAASNVAKAVFQDANTQTTVAGLHGSPLDLAAARKLLPLSRQTSQSCMSIVKNNASDENGNAKLVHDFGKLCDAAVQSAVEQFDSDAGTLLVKSDVAKRIRSELVENMYSDLEEQYEDQLKLLHTAAFESFKSSLSKLRLSPNLASDMEKVADDAVKLFADTAKTLCAKKCKSAGWPKADAQTVALKKELRGYITLRLQTAKADGKFKSVPRKGVTLGFHWLLPKPFGNDYRLEPWQVHAQDDLVYVPKDKISDVRKEDILTGDWRDSVVPCATANEMMYLK